MIEILVWIAIALVCGVIGFAVGFGFGLITWSNDQAARGKL